MDFLLLAPTATASRKAAARLPQVTNGEARPETQNESVSASGGSPVMVPSAAMRSPGDHVGARPDAPYAITGIARCCVSPRLDKHAGKALQGRPVTS
jgi:hypothetical protein